MEIVMEGEQPLDLSYMHAARMSISHCSQPVTSHAFVFKAFSSPDIIVRRHQYPVAHSYFIFIFSTTHPLGPRSYMLYLQGLHKGLWPRT